jgi:hypothetical protein
VLDAVHTRELADHQLTIGETVDVSARVPRASLQPSDERTVFGLVVRQPPTHSARSYLRSGRAMIAAAAVGSPKRVLENPDINALARAA